MLFEPEPGSVLDLNGDPIEFLPLTEEGKARIFVYAEVGKAATVYKVRKGKNQYFALKVFFPAFRHERLIRYNDQLQTLRSLDGLSVIDRKTITRQAFPQLVSQYPELEYAILMPWVQGDVWGNYCDNGHNLSPQDHLQLASNFARVVSGLEERSVAHCDLSHKNFIIGTKPGTAQWLDVQLIDIENMYVPNMPRLEQNLSYGTPGYRNTWIAENGLWGPAADRFAFAILCSEILLHQLPKAWNERSGETYFSEPEVGTRSDRYRQARESLGGIDPEIALLFETAWFSEKTEDCPATAKWHAAVNNISRLDSHNIELHKKPDIFISDRLKKDQTDEDGISKRLPPIMQFGDSVLNFRNASAETPKLTLSILNTGASTLNGKITPEKWLAVSPATFSIPPQGKSDITVILKGPLPVSQSKYEFRSPNALLIESNATTEVIGAVIDIGKYGNKDRQVTDSQSLHQNSKMDRKNAATASFVIGIISLIGFYIPALGYLGFLGGILGFMSIKSSRGGLALVGIIVSSLGILAGLFLNYGNIYY